MKEKIATALRHALTSLPAVGGYLLARGWLAAEEAAQLDALQEQALAGLAAIVAGVAARFILLGLARWAPGLQGVFGDGKGGASASTGGTGGMTPMWMVVGTAAALLAGGLLPSCAALGDMRVEGEACYILEDGAKVCLTGDETGRATVRGRIPLKDPRTGEVTGWVEGRVTPRVVAEK